MRSDVTAAVITQVGSLIYLGAWLVATQHLMAVYVLHNPESSWAICTLRRWQRHRERTAQRHLDWLKGTYQGPESSTEPDRPPLAAS